MEKNKQVNVLKGVLGLSERGVNGKDGRKIYPGDIVTDIKNNELGIMLGVKPMIENKTIRGKVIANIPTSEEAQTAVLLTIQETVIDSPELRIRYTNSRFLEKLGENEEPTSLTDLQQHCENECFLECSQECSLWKYKRGKS